MQFLVTSSILFAVSPGLIASVPRFNASKTTLYIFLNSSDGSPIATVRVISEQYPL